MSINLNWDVLNASSDILYEIGTLLVLRGQEKKAKKKKKASTPRRQEKKAKKKKKAITPRELRPKYKEEWRRAQRQQDFVKELRDNNDFANFVRMAPEEFDGVHELVGPLIAKSDTSTKDYILPEHKLAMALRYIATGASFIDRNYGTDLSPSAISNIVMEACNAIVKALSSYIKLPSKPEEWERVSKEFFDRWGFPNCVGSIDGKHVTQLSNIVVLAVVDANSNFLYVHAQTNGQESDGGVIRRTSFGKNLEQNKLNLPQPTKLPKSNKELPYVFISGKEFVLLENLMKPYFSKISVTVKEDIYIYNQRLSRARQVAERAFAQLCRFGVLQKKSELTPEEAQIVVLACCYLHNYLKSNKTCSRQRGKVSLTEHVFGNLKTSTRTNATNDSKRIRNDFKDYFNKEGRKNRI